MIKYLVSVYFPNCLFLLYHFFESRPRFIVIYFIQWYYLKCPFNLQWPYLSLLLLNFCFVLFFFFESQNPKKNNNNNSSKGFEIQKVCSVFCALPLDRLVNGFHSLDCTCVLWLSQKGNMQRHWESCWPVICLKCFFISKTFSISSISLKWFSLQP